MGHIPGRPVVALDIDGTTGAYHEHLYWFAKNYLGRPLELDWDPAFQGSFSRAMHIGKPKYREVKLAFRQGGLKRFMPVFAGARDLTCAVRRAGAELWICTTRPYMRLDNIDPDTRHWVDKRAKMQYDGILYGEKKYRDLAKIVGAENVVAVVDDLPEQVESAAESGITPILRRGDHNKWFRTMHNTAQDLPEAHAIVMELLAQWKREH